MPWLGWSCGECRWCLSGRENLCPRALFTGRDIDGGMAEYAVADARFCFQIPAGYPDEQAAPLMCAGLIGYRALRMCGDATRIGLYGFGASAHILAQVCSSQGREVYAFTRAGDEKTQAFARELGAVWAGASEDAPPQPLDAAIIFAPVGPLIPLALRRRRPRGHRRLRRHPHERHPLLPLQRAVAGARAALGRQPDARRRQGVPGARPAACPSRRASAATRWRLPTRRSPTCAPGASAAPP